MAVGHLSVCPLWRKVYSRSFAHFLIGSFVLLVWSHVSSLYILEIKLLSDVLLANMFSHTFGSLFILLVVSLAVQRSFLLCVVPFAYFLLYFHCPRDISAKILLCEIFEFLLPFHPAIPLLGLYSRKPKTPIQKNICTPVFIALFYNSQDLETV